MGDTTGLIHGIGHPISGPDHILAMVMVGVFAYRLGGPALWLVPSTFVLVMAFGGLMGVPVPFVELGFTLSVIVLSAIVALGVRPPVAAAMAIVGLFGVFHGPAHGAEMPNDAGGMAYAAGFKIATALLHVAGISIAFLIDMAKWRGVSIVPGLEATV